VQKIQGERELKLKVTDLIMSSRSPAMAEGRARLLAGLGEEDLSKRLQLAVDEQREKFPGDLSYDLQTKVFEAAAEKYDAPCDILALARSVFSTHPWVARVEAPPKTIVPSAPDVQDRRP
jgi:hypothetical protein